MSVPSYSRSRRALARCAAVLVTGGAIAVASAAPAASVEANACNLNPTNGTVTRMLGTRTYTVRVPSGITTPSAPLLVALHGNTGNSFEHESMTGWSPYADSKKFIVAYPQGIGNQWNTDQGSPDVTFLRQVVDHIAATWCVNPKAVFADGHSQGAMMSQRLACDAEDKFASVVTYAGSDATLFGSPCSVSRPIGVGLFHGYSDFVVPWTWDRDSANKWKSSSRDNCTATSTSSDSYGDLTKHTSCAGGVQVWLRLMNGQSHLWPTGAARDDTHNKMWAFLNANLLP